MRSSKAYRYTFTEVGVILLPTHYIDIIVISTYLCYTPLLTVVCITVRNSFRINKTIFKRKWYVWVLQYLSLRVEINKMSK